MQTPDNAGQADARPYRSALRAQQAELTRSLITRAAHESFLKNGWSGTSVRAVAASAGVSEATVYGTFGGKAGLAIALVDSVDLEADTERAGAELAA
ncbi:helix-turn-helix domain-containing protein, partial [Gordonia sp. (in: high G+C Gram-positive bacteria)]